MIFIHLNMSRTNTLGSGAHGSVIEEGIAVKQVNSTSTFIREATILCKTSACRNIVEYYGNDCDNRKIFMKKYDTDLRACISNLSLSEKERVCEDVIRALVSIHSINVVHGDIKPNNIFINGRRGNLVAVIGDLGNASIEDYCRTELGNWFYRGVKTTRDTSQDIYSAGIVMMELFGGYRITSCGAPTYSVKSYPDLPSIAKRINSEYSDIISRMVSKIPRDRPTALQVYQELGGNSRDCRNHIVLRKRCYSTKVHKTVFREIAEHNSCDRSKIVYTAIMYFLSYNQVLDEKLFVIVGALIGCCLYSDKIGDIWDYLPNRMRSLYSTQSMKKTLKYLMNDKTFCSSLY